MDKFKLAEYIAAKYPGEVTPMKLQKLLYYCYAWQLVAKEKQFSAGFEAWEYGPVEPEIYRVYKVFSGNPIKVDEIPPPPPPLFDFILDSYSVYSAIELSKTTHFEQPWKKYKNTGELIPDEELEGFYSQQPFAWNFPLSKEKKYFPPKTASHYAFTFDMDKDYVPVFESLEHYLNNFTQEKAVLDEILTRHGIKN